MSESGKAPNAGATKPEGSPEAGAQTSSSLSSSLVRSSSSLRTLVEQVQELVFQTKHCIDFGYPQKAHHKLDDAGAHLRELAALLSPVEGRTYERIVDTSVTLPTVDAAEVANALGAVEGRQPTNEIDQMGGLLQSLAARTSERDQARAALEMLDRAYGEEHARAEAAIQRLATVEGRQQVTEETRDDLGLPGSAATKGLR